MSFDQPLYSFQYSGGEPPTPTRTPTSPSFFLNSFETPKQDSKNNSRHSPWGTSFANALSPSFKTPNFATFSPLTPTANGPSGGRDVEAAITTHEQLSQVTIPDSQPGDSSQHLDYEPFDLSGFVSGDGKPQDELKASIDTTVSSARSMQTPPPTSTSATRRKAQQAQVARLDKDSVSRSSRRMSSPAMAQDDQQLPQNTVVEESPLQFPNLQFSPDGFSFPMSGPATAPVYPQQKLFWDPEQQANGMNIDMSMDDTFNAFGITSQKFSDPFASGDNQAGLLSFTASPSTGAVQQSAGISSSHAPALNPTSLSSSAAIITQGPSNAKDRGVVVDPSLLFTSPSRFADMHQNANFSQPLQDENLQPYAQQMKDAQLEKEIQARKPKRKRPPELGESPAVRAATAALRDESTNSAMSSPVIADSFFGALPEGPPQLERALPSRKRMTPDNHHQKHGGQSSLSRRRSSKQPSVTLKIDPSGRAVTETSFAKDPKGSRMDIDSESESSASSSVSEERTVHIPQKSFHPPGPSQVRRARFVDEPYSHSQRSSDASTWASRRPGSRVQGRLSMNAGHAQVHFPSSQALVTQDDDSEVSTIVDSDEDRGDAQSELKKLVRQRSMGKTGGKASSSSVSKHNGNPASRQSYAPSESFSHAYPIPPVNSSPTTITDPNLTPGSGRVSNISNDVTRCICGSADGGGQLMIQCESCRKWLHTNCVGLNRNNLPTVYLCTFCTQTPRAVRGRGQKEPSRMMLGPPNARQASPLGYKSSVMR